MLGGSDQSSSVYRVLDQQTQVARKFFHIYLMRLRYAKKSRTGPAFEGQENAITLAANYDNSPDTIEQNC
jgi:hypothetical protein